MGKKFSCTFTGKDHSHPVTLNGKNVPQGMVYDVEIPNGQSSGPSRSDIEKQMDIKFGTWVGTTIVKNHPNWIVAEIK